MSENGNGTKPAVSAVSRLNKKQLAFLLGIIEGKADYVAYMAAYGVEEMVAKAAASRALTSVRMAAALDEMRAEVIERVVAKSAVDKQWVIDRFVRNAQVSMREIPVEVARSSTGKKIEIFEEYNGSVANAALTKIGEELGMFRVRIQDIPWDDLTPEELKQIEKGILPFKLRRAS